MDAGMVIGISLFVNPVFHGLVLGIISGLVGNWIEQFLRKKTFSRKDRSQHESYHSNHDARPGTLLIIRSATPLADQTMKNKQRLSLIHLSYLCKKNGSFRILFSLH